MLPFAATHDIELSYVLEDLYDNYHFEEEVKEKEVVFSYILKKGRATSRNAIRLLDMLEYDPKIVEGAAKAARDFEEKGVWESLKKYLYNCCNTLSCESILVNSLTKTDSLCILASIKRQRL